MRKRKERYSLPTQKCSCCETIKPVEDFEWQPNRPNPRKICSKCRNKNNWRDIKNNPEKLASHLKKRRRYVYNNRDAVNERRKLMDYSISQTEYQEMLKNQGYACALCDSDLDLGKYTHIDHDHKTGRIRAVLCRRCNSGLGFFRDDPAVLRRAAKYIERHQLGGDIDWESIIVSKTIEA